MKTAFFIAALLFLFSTGYSQVIRETEVPAAVKSAFAHKFLNVATVKWEKEHSNEFEAGFTNAGVEMTANFSADGKWLETETEIKFSQLPQAVSASFSKNHKNSSKAEAAKIELASGKIIYEIELKGSDEKGSKGSKEVKGSKGSKEDKGSHENEFFYDETGKQLKGSKL